MKSHLPLALARVAPEKTQDRPSCGRSNAERAEKLAGRGVAGEKGRGKGWEGGMLASLGEDQRPLGALRAAFGPRVDGLRIEEGKSAENEKIGAEAHAEGSAVRLSDNINMDDPELMGILAHEVAHALAPQGQAEELDQPGDPGEVKAEEAGDRFEAWAKSGFEGPAPQLQPAAGGRARIQRSQGEDAPATDAPGEELSTEESWLDQALGGLSRGVAFQRDLRLALGEVPLHAAGVLGETAELIWEHLDAFVLTLGIFWGLEAGVGLLTAAPDPSFVTKGLAVLLQGILLLFLGFGVVVEAAQAVMYGWEGMKKAWEAEGDPQKISEASVAFCRMLLHAVLAVLAILALRGGVGRGLTGTAGKGEAAGAVSKGGGDVAAGVVKEAGAAPKAMEGAKVPKLAEPRAIDDPIVEAAKVAGEGEVQATRKAASGATVEGSAGVPIRLPRNPDDLLRQGFRETSHPEAAARGHRSFENPQTGEKIRFDKGEEGETGHAAKDHYHRENPRKTGKKDAYLDSEGIPVAKGSGASHIYPED